MKYCIFVVTMLLATPTIAQEPVVSFYDYATKEDVQAIRNDLNDINIQIAKLAERVDVIASNYQEIKTHISKERAAKANMASSAGVSNSGVSNSGASGSSSKTYTTRTYSSSPSYRTFRSSRPRLFGRWRTRGSRGYSSGGVFG